MVVDGFHAFLDRPIVSGPHPRTLISWCGHALPLMDLIDEAQPPAGAAVVSIAGKPLAVRAARAGLAGRVTEAGGDPIDVRCERARTVVVDGRQATLLPLAALLPAL